MKIWGDMKHEGIQGAMAMVVNIASINDYQNSPS